MPSTRTRVGAPDDHQVRVGAGRHRLPDSVGGEPDRHQVVDADVVLDPARQQLVLDLDALDAGRLRHGDGAVDVDRVAPAAAGVQHHRDLGDGADIDHHLDHLGQRQAGLGDALVPAERAAREVAALKPACAAICAMIGLSATGATIEVGALDELAEFFHGHPPVRHARPCAGITLIPPVLEAEWHAGMTAGRTAVAKLKVMCARSMHVAVGALGQAFARGRRP